MRASGGGVGMLFAAGLMACNPPLALQYRQQLRPGPTPDCVAAAIAVSPAVARVTPVGRNSAFFIEPPGVLVVPRDSAAGAQALVMSVTQVAFADSSARVAVTYEYVDYAAPTADQRAHWAALADTLLTAVRAACAAGSTPAPVDCRRLHLLHRQRPCDAG